ncbi:hypothetical protein VTI74DRAFT_9306 [Chaetomium olivicolor]
MQELLKTAGPKLTPISPTAHVDIEFSSQLGDPENDQDAHVWKVRIEGNGPYALKMLRRNSAANLLRSLATPQYYRDFYDSFNCECRAYARLKQESREDLAIQAHGEKYTPDDTEPELDGTRTWRRCEEHRHLPVRAIVKDLCTESGYFTPSDIAGIWRDLEGFHELGILVRDVRIGNYMGGKLIDLNWSWTMPHPSFIYLSEAALNEERRLDAHSLRMAILDHGDEEKWCWSEVEIPEDLINCAIGYGLGRYGIDPREYDWRRWEESPRVMVAFMTKKLLVKD